MEPLTMALIGAGIQTVGGLVAEYLRQGKTDEANAILAKAREQYGNVNLDELPLSGIESTELGKVQTDKALRDAQLGALAKMKEVGEKGFTAEEQAALNKIRNDTANADQARRASIISNMQARGQGGSGAELAMQLEGAQSAADRESQAGLDIAAQAQRRALEAIRAQANMAGDVRNVDFNEASTRAKAQDELNRFNFGAARDATQYNNNLRLGKADRAYNMAKDEAGLVAGQGNASATTVAGTTNAMGQGFQTYAAAQEKNQDKNQDKKNPNDPK